jgi:hypothetical protein
MYHDWTGGTNDRYTLGTITGLVYEIDKDFSWFSVTDGNFANVLIDNIIVNTGNYTTQSGSTLITLLPSYLNGIETGNHLFTVRFTDGVSVPDTFTILPATTIIPPIPSNPTVPTSSG